MGEWKRVKLGEVCSKIGSGATPTGGKSAYKDDGVSLIRSQNVLDMSFALAGLAHIDDEQARKLDGVTVCRGDVLLNITGDSVARCCIVPDYVLPARVNQHVCIVRPRPDLATNRFVEYFLIAIKDRLLTLASVGATRNALTKETIQNLEVPLPPLPTQRRIAAVLGALDDKIEVNRKICENLEAQAQALFKAWFVDFEPFGGKRPEGWKMGKLGEVVEFKNGFAFKSSEFKERARYKVMTIKAVQNGKLVTEGADCIDDIPTKMPSWCVLRDADVLMSLTGNVARCCLVCEDDLLLNQRVAKLVPRLSGDVAFVYALFRSDEMRKRLETIAKGTAQANLSPIESAELLQLIPGEAERTRFANLCNPMIEVIVKTSRESRALAAMRDALLPKLMSGELAVEKVEVADACVSYAG